MSRLVAHANEVTPARFGDLRALGRRWDDADPASAAVPVMATPAAVAAGVGVTAAAFGAGVAVGYAVS